MLTIIKLPSFFRIKKNLLLRSSLPLKSFLFYFFCYFLDTVSSHLYWHYWQSKRKTLEADKRNRYSQLLLCMEWLLPPTQTASATGDDCIWGLNQTPSSFLFIFMPLAKPLRHRIKSLSSHRHSGEDVSAVTTHYSLVWQEFPSESG